MGVAPLPASQNPSEKRLCSSRDRKQHARSDAEISLLTGGSDKPYAFGLAMALVSKGLNIDVLGSEEVSSPELQATPNLNFLSLQGNKRPDARPKEKVWRILTYYGRLVRYASSANPRVFHILWNNKFQIFDRTLLMLYYKLHRKKIVLTVHNVNAAKRDSSDSLLNRLTLRIQYRLADHSFVHTQKMKRELHDDFGVPERAVTVIPFGINNSVPATEVTIEEAKQRMGIKPGERTILFFGRIRPYKGLEYLVAAFQQIVAANPAYRLIIAGEPMKETKTYLDDIQLTINRGIHRDRVIQKIQFIPDDETELYFKAADVLVLPYKQIFQSGVLFLGYSFGLPVVATDVGSFKEEIVEGRTGFVCRPCDIKDLAKTIEKYFDSDLFKYLKSRRQEIREYANAQHSWDVVGEMTRNVYAQLLGRMHYESTGIHSHSCIQRTGMDR
jgi:D-inositol-3-phosphate glycosyltransferase